MGSVWRFGGALLLIACHKGTSPSEGTRDGAPTDTVSAPTGSASATSSATAPIPAGDGGACPWGQMIGYSQSGCDEAAVGSCLGPMPPCVEQFCGCSGSTLQGCGFATAPFKHRGPCIAKASSKVAGHWTLVLEPAPVDAGARPEKVAMDLRFVQTRFEATLESHGVRRTYVVSTANEGTLEVSAPLNSKAEYEGLVFTTPKGREVLVAVGFLLQETTLAEGSYRIDPLDHVETRTSRRGHVRATRQGK